MDTKYNSEVGTVTYRLKEAYSDKPTLIKGIYLFKNFQTGFTTGIKVLPKNWDKTEKKVLAGSEKKIFNEKLNKYKNAIPIAHREFNEQFGRIPTKDELKTIVETAINKNGFRTVDKKKKSFDDVFIDFIELQRLKVQQAVVSGQPPLHKSYLSTFNVAYSDLKEFANEQRLILDLDTFDERLCLEFQNWLIKKKKIKASTLRTRIKRISQVLRWAFKKGYTENRSFMQDEFSVKVPATSHITLTENEITTLFEYDFSDNKRLEKVRDLFVLGCHTSLRFGDLIRIVPQHIDFNAKIIHILTEKVTLNLDVPFFGYTEEILKKYEGNIKNISLSNQNANSYLKEIFKIIPYFKDKKFTTETKTNKGVEFKETLYGEKITFHDSRRTFCTNRYLDGWDLLEIWQFTGHTNEGTFKGYVKPTPEHERIRKENIIGRNEKLLRVDILQKQIDELSKLIPKESLGKIIKIG